VQTRAAPAVNGSHVSATDAPFTAGLSTVRGSAPGAAPSSCSSPRRGAEFGSLRSSGNNRRQKNSGARYDATRCRRAEEKPVSRTKRSALLAGASGLVGAALLDLLLEHDEYETVHSLVRNATGVQHQKLKEHCVNFDELGHYALDTEITDAFCCLGTTMRKAGSREAFATVDRDYPLAFAALARRCGCNRFAVVSALGAASGSAIFYNRVKGEMEEGLEKMEFSHLAIIRPSLLLGQRREFRAGEALSAPFAVALSPLLRGSLRRYRPVAVTRVARAALEALDDPGSGVQVIYPTEQPR
jgi:uncharacterized protein YbjT (DUF2867 family)